MPAYKPALYVAQIDFGIGVHQLRRDDASCADAASTRLKNANGQFA